MAATKTILIIDSYQTLLRLYEKEFNQEGYRVLTARDSFEALEKIAGTRPDLVVIDQRPFGRAELQAIEAIGRVGGKKRPLFVLNGSPTAESLEPAPWIDFFVPKSSDLEPLKSTVRCLLERRFQPRGSRRSAEAR